MPRFNFLLYYQYLYSPKSWLHASKSNYKIFFIFLQLLLLPYIPSAYIVFVLPYWIIIFEIICVSANKYPFLQKFGWLLLLTTFFHTYWMLHKKVNCLDAVSCSVITDIPYGSHLLSLYISWPVWRLASISIIYLIIIKIFLLTTHYEEIMYFLFYKRKICNQSGYLDTCLMTVLCLQVTNIVFSEVKKKCAAYSLRGKLDAYNNLINRNYVVYLSISKIALVSLVRHVYSINNSLYSRAIYLSSLYILNTYKRLTSLKRLLYTEEAKT